MSEESLDQLAGISLMFGACAQFVAILFHGSAVVSGRASPGIPLAFWLLWGYIFLVLGSFYAHDGRRPGETGVRYLGRVAVWPYAAGLRLCILAATAAPGVARECIEWLTTPREDDEVGKE